MLLAALVLATCSQDPAQAGPWGLQLAFGSHAVGFEQGWTLDHGRTYRTAFDGGATYGAEPAPRPVLVQFWYPAEAERAAELPAMPYARYLELEGPPELGPLGTALADHARSVLVGELFGVDESELDERRRDVLIELLATLTSCRLDAPAADGRFPLVLYHSGAGSSYEDNALLCEYLASHGFAVLASAFPEGDGSSLGIDADEGSFADLQALLRWARERANVDGTRVALAGHSLGAQTVLRHASRPGVEARAVVLLDTTQDYYALSWPSYRELVDECLAGATELREALLFAAGPEALFGLADRLVHAERTYYTQGMFDHNEFIAQGMQTLWARELLEPPPDTSIVHRERRRAFADLCEYVRCFLDVHLAGRPGEELAALDGVYRDSWLGGVAPHVEHAPRGTDGPEPFEPSGDRLVTPRQFARILRDEGVEAALAIPLFAPGFHQKSEVLRSSMLMGSLLRDLVQDGREADATRLYAGLKAHGARPLSVFPFQADMAELLGRPERGIDALRTYLFFEPDDADVRARLEALEARQGGR